MMLTAPPRMASPAMASSRLEYSCSQTWTFDPEPNTISFATKVPVCLNVIGFSFPNYGTPLRCLLASLTQNPDYM
jgi:hypothetical protein